MSPEKLGKSIKKRRRSIEKLRRSIEKRRRSIEKLSESTEKLRKSIQQFRNSIGKGKKLYEKTPKHFLIYAHGPVALELKDFKNQIQNKKGKRVFRLYANKSFNIHDDSGSHQILLVLHEDNHFHYRFGFPLASKYKYFHR